MNWSSKSFALQLIFAILGTLTLGIIVNQIIVSTKRDQGEDTTRFSIFIAGMTYPCLHGIIGGWKTLNPKALFLVCFIITGLFTGKPAVAIFGVIVCAFLYIGPGRLRNIILFYRSKDSATPEDPKSNQLN